MRRKHIIFQFPGHFFCRGDAAFAHWGRSLLARGGHFFRKSLGPRKRIPVGRSLSGDGHFFDKFWGPRKWIWRGGHFQGTVTFGGPLGPSKWKCLFTSIFMFLAKSNQRGATTGCQKKCKKKTKLTQLDCWQIGYGRMNFVFKAVV